MAEKPCHIFLINLLSYSIGWPHSSGCFTNNLLSHSCFNFSTGVFAMYVTTTSLLLSRAHEWKHLPSLGEDLRRSSPPWKTVLSHVSWSFGPDGFSRTQGFFFLIIPPHLENTPNTSIINSYPWLSTPSLKATQFFLLCLSPWGKIYDFPRINVGKFTSSFIYNFDFSICFIFCTNQFFTTEMICLYDTIAEISCQVLLLIGTDNTISYRQNNTHIKVISPFSANVLWDILMVFWHSQDWQQSLPWIRGQS